MKILFYAAKTFDKESFNAIIDRYPDISIDYVSHELGPRSATMADGYDAINTDTGLHLIGQTDPSIFATVRDDEGNIIFGINSMPLIYTDPVTGYHYIFWNTKGNDSGFIMPGDYDFMSVSGPDRLHIFFHDPELQDRSGRK